MRTQLTHRVCGDHSATSSRGFCARSPRQVHGGYHRGQNWRMGRPAWLTRTVVVLTAVSLLQDAASELLYPLLPLLLTSVLHAPATVIGVIEGLAEGAAGLAKLVSGRISDRWGRKPVTAFGYTLAALGKVIVAAAGSWHWVLAGRVTDRLGKGTRAAARDAWLASGVQPEHLGRVFGFHRMGDSVGAVIGPLLGLAALALTNDLRTALWFAVVPAAGSALLVLLAPERRRASAPAEPGLPGVAVAAADAGGPTRGLTSTRETADSTTKRATSQLAPEGGGVKGHPSPPDSRRQPLGARFWRACFVLTAIALVNFPDALLLLRLHDLGWSTQGILLGYVLFNLVYAVAALPAGMLADRFGPLVSYGAGLLAFGAAYAGLGTVAAGQSDWRTWTLLAVYGLFPAGTDGVGKAWISRTVADAVRGRAQGIFQAMGNGAVLAAGLWAGLLWSAGSGKGVVPLMTSGIVGSLAAIVLLAVGLRRRGLGSAVRQAGVAE